LWLLFPSQLRGSSGFTPLSLESSGSSLSQPPFIFRGLLASVIQADEHRPYGLHNFNELVKNRNSITFVIPAKAGIQSFQDILDPGFRRGDASRDFLRDHQF
jgi:hypothetical protein